MANQLSVTLGVPVLFDGTSTTVAIDLAHDPYGVSFGDPEGSVEGLLTGFVNWFSQSPLGNLPVGVVSPANGYTASLSGTTLTLTYATAPAAGGTTVAIYLLF